MTSARLHAFDGSANHSSRELNWAGSVCRLNGTPCWPADTQSAAPAAFAMASGRAVVSPRPKYSR
jgi:hypothetical protein